MDIEHQILLLQLPLFIDLGVFVFIVVLPPFA